MDGILIVDKPTTWTSHDVCAFVKKRFQIKKVGHAGTLDPLATGVLVLLLGKATKQSNELSARDKAYDGLMELGIRTDSHDRNGKVIDQAPWEHIRFEDVQEKAVQFRGSIKQTPPMVSALKHQGVRLYRLARKGLTVPREERSVTVYELQIKSQEGPFVHFSSCVSKGTYLRTLVNDLGDALGCYATLAQLRRMRSGEFDLSQSVTVEEIRKLKAGELSSKTIPFSPTLSYANHLRPRHL